MSDLESKPRLESNGTPIKKPEASIADEKVIRRWEAIVANISSSRKDWIRLLQDPRRDIEVECGYPEGFVDCNFYQGLYDRLSIAERVVEVLPKESWIVQPEVYEDEDAETDTEFEQAWNELGQSLRGEQCWYDDQSGSAVWEYLQRIDEQSGIGQYGILLMGFDDGLSLDQPIIGKTNSGLGKGTQPQVAGTPNDAKSPKSITKNSIKKLSNKHHPSLTFNRLIKMERPSKPVLNGKEIPYDQWNKIVTNGRNISGSTFRPNPSNYTGPSSQYNPETGGMVGPDVDGVPREKLAQYGNTWTVDQGDVQAPAGETPEDLSDVKTGGGPHLTFLRVFAEPLCPVVQFETNPASPRYGQPIMYLVTFNDPRAVSSGTGLSTSTFSVHWTRVIHIAESLESSEIFARPRMRACLDHLLAIKKIYGGCAEGYWQSCFPTKSFETQDADVDVNLKAIKDSMENLRNTLQRDIFTQGMTVKTLPPQVVDPTPHINVHIEGICIEIGCPVRVFKGSERGELASTQDDSKWNDRLKQRQTNYITPKVIRPFVSRLIALGTLPEPESYKVDWPDLDSMTDAERATILLTRTQAYGTFVSQGVEAIVPPLEYMTTFDNLTPDEANNILNSAKDHQEETQANEMQQQQDMIDAGLAPDPTKPSPDTVAKIGSSVPKDGTPSQGGVGNSPVGNITNASGGSSGGDGHWVTTEKGQHVYITGDGEMKTSPTGITIPKKGDSNGGSNRGSGDDGTGEHVKGTSGSVEGSTGATGGKGTDQSGNHKDKPTSDGSNQRTTAEVHEINKRLDRYEQLFRNKGQHELADWMGKLRQHVNEVGAHDLLEAVGGGKGKGSGEKVQYGGVNTEDSPNWAASSHFITSYLNRSGIIPLVGQEAKAGVKIIHSQTNDDPFANRGKVKGDFQPVGPAYDDKLQESKDLPGLGRSEDIGKVMGHTVTHLTPEVTAKMDKEYGKDQWLIKTYGDYAFAGQGIFFPQRIKQISQDAKNTIWTAGQHLDKYGFQLARDGKTGEVKGLVHKTGDTYHFDSPEYNHTINGDAKHWAEQAKLAAENEKGAKLPYGGKDFMVQPAFAAVGVSEKDRAEGKTIAPGEGRVHLVIRNGKAEPIPHTTWIKGESLPVVFENADTKAMAKAAQDAINSLPAAARNGQIYAPDVLKTKDGYKVVELNASVEYGGSGYLSDNPLIIDSLVSHLTDRDPAHVRFIRNLLTKTKTTNKLLYNSLTNLLISSQEELRWLDLVTNYDPDQPREPDGKFGHGIVSSLKSIGAKVGHVEHVAKAFAEDKISSAVSRLPKSAQAVVKAAYAIAKAGTKVLFATWTAGQILAEKVATERGSTSEEARKLRGILSSIDIATMKPIQLGLGASGLGSAALPASFIPPATIAYLAYSTARNPLATYKAASKLIKSGAGKIAGKMVGNASTDDVNTLAEHLEVHDYSDWYIALLHAALTETGSLNEAFGVADKAWNHNPEDVSIPQPDDESVVLDN